MTREAVNVNHYGRQHHGEGSRTRSEVGKSFFKAILITIAQDPLVLSPDLFECTQNHEQEAGVPFGDFTRMPFHGGLLSAISSHCRADCHCSRESTCQR